jgi:hypothetical protein
MKKVNLRSGVARDKVHFVSLGPILFRGYFLVTLLQRGTAAPVDASPTPPSWAISE